MEKTNKENLFRNKSYLEIEHKWIDVHCSKIEIEINFVFFLEAKLINDIITDRSWINLFSLCLSRDFDFHEFNIAYLIKYLKQEEIITFDSHPELF